MFGIGMPELVMIFVVALIVLGPKRLPDVAKGFARAMAEFRRATSGIGDELESARRMLEDEVRAAEREIAERPLKVPDGTTIARGSSGGSIGGSSGAPARESEVPQASDEDEDDETRAAITTTRPPGEPKA